MTSKKNVSFIQPQLYPFFNTNLKKDFGGSEAQFYILSQALSKKNDYQICCVVGDYQQKNIETHGAIKIYRAISPSSKKLKKIFQVFYLLFIIHKTKADVVIQRSANPITGLLAFYSKLTNKKLIYMVACEADTDSRNKQLLNNSKINSFIYLWGLKNADLVIAQTRQQQQNLIKNFNKNSVVIHSPLYQINNVDSFEKTTVLWVGRADLIKKPEIFINLAKNNPSHHFTMICPPAKDQQYFKEIKAKSSLINNLEFIDYVPFSKIDFYFKKAKILINTSDFEGFPNAFIQGAKNKVAILSFIANPDNFITNYQCGFCAKGDLNQLNQKLKHLLENLKLTFRYAENAYRYAKKYHDLDSGIVKLDFEIKKMLQLKNNFNFGINWMNYSKNALNAKKIKEAQESLNQLIGTENIKNKSFIDIGCGSGIFTLAAKSIGSQRTVGIDISSESIAAAEYNKKITGAQNVRFEKINLFNTKDLNNLGLFDVVYSWGVLHHTGQMWQAIKIAKELTMDKGLFIIAIYNKHWSSPFWKKIKKIYNQSPVFLQKIIISIFITIIFTAKFLITFKNPLNKKRGMSFYYDVIDWLGGYPYEYAAPNEIIEFCQKQNLRLIKIIAAPVPTGCNEFVFRKITPMVCAE